MTIFFVSIAGQAAAGAYGEVVSAIFYWRGAYGDEVGGVAETFNQAGIFLWSGGILASLAFMWRVRHPRNG